MKRISVAIDGPAGAGKSSIAKLVAEQLGYIYIDTGAMFRAVTWNFLQRSVDISNLAQVESVLADTNIEFINEQGRLTVIVNGIDVTEAIRQPDVTAQVSHIATLESVREALLALQRSMSVSGGVIMDGRDIGSVVLPQAELKIFLTASIECRAKRRAAELEQNGLTIDLKQLHKEIAGRDKKDSQRIIAPLVQLPDAWLLDTTKMTIEQVVMSITDRCKDLEQSYDI